jgi:hypothetical protein
MRTNSNFVSAFKCVHENSPRFVSAGEDVQQPADVRLRLLRRRVLLRGGGPVGLRRPGQGPDGRLWSPAAQGDLSCHQAGWVAAGAPWGPAAAGAPGSRTPLRQPEGGRAGAPFGPVHDDDWSAAAARVSL